MCIVLHAIFSDYASSLFFFLFFFFNDTATTEIYTLSLHDALPIFINGSNSRSAMAIGTPGPVSLTHKDRKSTRLNSSHTVISYAVFCLKKKNKKKKDHQHNPQRNSHSLLIHAVN